MDVQLDVVAVGVSDEERLAAGVIADSLDHDAVCVKVTLGRPQGFKTIANLECDVVQAEVASVGATGSSSDLDRPMSWWLRPADKNAMVPSPKSPRATSVRPSAPQ